MRSLTLAFLILAAAVSMTGCKRGQFLRRGGCGDTCGGGACSGCPDGACGGGGCAGCNGGGACYGGGCGLGKNGLGHCGCGFAGCRGACGHGVMANGREYGRPTGEYFAERGGHKCHGCNGR